LKHLIATWQHQLRELEKMEYQKLEWIQTHYLVISTPFSYPHFIRVLLPMSDVWQLNFLRDKIKNTHFMKAQRNTNNPYYFSVFFASSSSCSRIFHFCPWPEQFLSVYPISSLATSSINTPSVFATRIPFYLHFLRSTLYNPFSLHHQRRIGMRGIIAEFFSQKHSMQLITAIDKVKIEP
jgi:hypothetical protein